MKTSGSTESTIRPEKGGVGVNGDGGSFIQGFTWLRLRSSMMRLMMLASRSKSCQKVEKLSKSPKNLKNLKSCKGHRFGGTFTDAQILRQEIQASVRVLTNFQAIFCWVQELFQYHFCFDYRQSQANRAANTLSVPSFYLYSARLPFATLALECTLERQLKNLLRTSFLCYFDLGDALRRKTSKPRIKAERFDG